MCVVGVDCCCARRAGRIGTCEVVWMWHRVGGFRVEQYDIGQYVCRGMSIMHDLLIRKTGLRLMVTVGTSKQIRCMRRSRPFGRLEMC